MTTQLAGLFALAIAAIGTSAGEALRFARLPHPSVYRMANIARAIVEGKENGDGTVTVTMRHFVRPGDRVADTIRVAGLATMPRSVQQWGVRNFGNAGAIGPDAVLLFLQDNPENDDWVAVHHHGKAARGVIWFEKDVVWGYHQLMNPGPYELSRWQVREGKQFVAADPDDIRALVTAGLAARSKWYETLALADRSARAGAVARWFSPSTSPDGDRWDERIWPDLMEATEDLGELMNKPLARIVRADPSARAVSSAADALLRLGDRGTAAAPSLIARLRDLRGVEPIFLVRALRRLADPRAVSVLRDYVAHEDLFVATEAAAALHASGGKGAVELLTPRVPETIATSAELGVVSGMLELIHDLEPAVAERLVKERFLDHDQLMMQRPWLRALRDDRSE